MQKRVLIMGSADSFFTRPFERAFQALGFECALFPVRHGMVYSNKQLRRLIRVFPHLRFIKSWSVNRENRHLIKYVAEYKPWLVFGIKAETIPPETIEKIKKMGVITALFFNDLIDHWELIKKLAPAYDYFFNQDHLIVSKLRDELGLRNVYYMAHATEPTDDPFKSRNNKYPIAFIGTHDIKFYPNREKYLLAINDLDLHIWGTDGWANTPLKNCFHGRSVGDQRFDIYGSSKIVIDINWDIMPAEGLSNRPFEVAGCGAMFMTDHVRKDIKRAYQEGREVVLFKDEHELREKVIYYLEHEDERKKIAQAGYQRTVAEHTYDNRVRQIMNTINDESR